MKSKKTAITKLARRQHSSQFKQLAVDRSEKESVATVAADLGISEAQLYSWRHKRLQAGKGFEEQQLQQAEMARLKRENARLEEELAFLKKAAAYFAKQPR
jgi:transposase